MEDVKALRIIALLAIAAAMLAGAAFILRDHLAGWWIRQHLAAELARQLGAEVVLEGVQYERGVLRVEHCRVSGDAMPFAELEIKEASAPMDWQRLRNLAGGPLAIEASAVDFVWRDVPPAPTPAAPGRDSPGMGRPPDLDILVGKFSFRHEDPARWQIQNSAVRGALAAGRWNLAARGGTLTAQGWPAFTIERVSAEQLEEGWNIASFALQSPDQGAVGGSANVRDGRWSGEFSWQDVALREFLPAGAEAHFTGRGSGDARLGGGVLEGRMKIEGAEVRNLPALVSLASIFNGEDYRTVPWKSLHFKFRRDAAGMLDFEELQAVSPKGVAVQGSGKIAGQNVAADVQLGVQRAGRPWLVAFMPVLFRTEKNGYLWTPVKVGGTLQAPTEDLTPRVIAALPATSAVETAVELPAGAVEEAGALLRSLLGK